MDISWYVYVGFFAFVLAMLVVDVKFFHAEAHEPTVKESATWVGVWIALAVLFGIGLFAFLGHKQAGEYFAGYLIEYSLSVDNMFVFIVIFAYFGIPRALQHRVLFFGIIGAIVLRGLFIGVGVALINAFEWTIYVFGVFLLYTAYKLARGGGDDFQPEKNPVLNFAQKRLPTTDKYKGQKLFILENAKRVATPLFVCLVFIDVIDVLFAVDSIPAIFAVTKDPFIVLTSNMFAILGLRALYFLIAGAMDRFHLLNYGLSVILGFVGVKMLLEAAHVHIPIVLSLGVIVAVLVVTMILSRKIPPKEGHRPPSAAASG